MVLAQTGRDVTGARTTATASPAALNPLGSDSESAENQTRISSFLSGTGPPAAKTDDDTEQQLVHTLAHAIVFIVLICCL